MARSAALPFTVRRSRDVIAGASVTTLTEIVYGLLRVTDTTLVVQWQLARQTDHVGLEIRSDEQIDAVREVAIPLEAVAGGAVRRRWWRLLHGPEIVLTAADLGAFEAITGDGGLRSAHPAELVLQLRRGDRLAAEEFSAELALARAELAPPAGLDELPGPEP